MTNKHQICYLFNNVKRIRNAARPKHFPQFINLALKFSGYHWSIPHFILKNAMFEWFAVIFFVPAPFAYFLSGVHIIGYMVIKNEQETLLGLRSNFRYYFKSTMLSVFPNGSSIFRRVAIVGLVSPFSSLDITGCFTPLSSSNFL